MLRLFRRMKGVLLDKIEDTWQGRFTNGISFAGMVSMLIRFPQGIKAQVTLAQIVSLNTGHWPIALFDACYISGDKSCWHLHVLGLTIGSLWLPDLKADDKGNVEVVGPDYRKFYFMFSCINHQGKQLQEIV